MNIGGYDAPRNDVTVCGDYDRFINNARNARMYFCLPHMFFDCDVSILVAGNISLNVEPEVLVREWLGDADMAVFRHPIRNCVYAEAEAAKVRVKHTDEIALLDAQAEHYRTIGIPEHIGSLPETGVTIRKHNDRVRAFNADWWAEVCRWSYRDQVSFPVVLARHKDLKVNFIEGNLRHNPYIKRSQSHNTVIPTKKNIQQSQVVDSYNIELGYELLSAVPYAYELHLNGRLNGTRSGTLSESFYPFSPRHEINPEPRSWYNTSRAGMGSRAKNLIGLPWVDIHKPEQPHKVFPDYRKYYEAMRFDKPTLCICNRANIEWDHSVINYFDADILDWMFAALKEHYHIVYFPISIPAAIQDNAKPKQLFDDTAIARRHGVSLITDLGEHWNDTMLRVFSGCEHYITMNGGYSILASYFAGTNIIYSKPGKPETKELRHGSFWRWYPNINNVRTLHVPSYDDLKERIQTLYIEKIPTANVLIRTSNRPIYFKGCIESVLSQDYPNINIVIICDDEASLPYTRGYPARCITPDKVAHRTKPKGEQYGKWFPANDYIRQALEKVSGYVFILDDDDMYIDDSAISKVMANVRPDAIACWKVKFDNCIRPNGSFGIKPTMQDIDSNGMCWHTSMKTDWSPFKRADYRTAAMFKNIIWIDEVLSGVQKTPGYGRRIDKKCYICKGARFYAAI